MNPPKIISLGEVLWDLFPEGEQFGGAPANFACHAAVSGGTVTMVSSVGRDRRGQAAFQILQSYGVDVSQIQVDPNAPTGSVGVVVNDEGKPTFTIHEGSAWDSINWTDALESSVRNADALYFGTLGQRSAESRETIRQCVKTARTAGIPRMLDINLRPPFFDAAMIRDSVRLSSILKLSDDELPQVCDACGIEQTSSTVEQLQQLLKSENLDSVVMTRGADGALLVKPDEVIRQRGISATVVDTVGAGDSFAAAFLIGLLQGQTDHQNLEHACMVAAAVCTHSGAVPPRSADPVTLSAPPELLSPDTSRDP